MNATASSYPDDAKNAVDLGTNSRYCPRNEKNTWMCYNFKELLVIRTSYSVRSHEYGPRWNHLKPWVIEVSNDGSSWTEIDHLTDNNDLNDRHATAKFKISKGPSESYRFFRLKQTGKNHDGDCVSLFSPEIFRTLFEK